MPGVLLFGMGFVTVFLVRVRARFFRVRLVVPSLVLMRIGALVVRLRVLVVLGVPRVLALFLGFGVLPCLVGGLRVVQVRVLGVVARHCRDDEQGEGYEAE